MFAWDQRLRRLMIGVAVMILCAVPLFGQPPSREQEITHFINGFVAAWNRADPAALGAMFAPHAVFQTPSGHADSRAEIEALLRREERELFKDRRLSVHVGEIRFHSPYDAEVETDFLLDGYSAMGFGSAPPGSLSFVLHKADGRWEIREAAMQR